MKSSTTSTISLLICLFLLTAIATASAQLAPVQRMPFAEHLEKYDNPPAPPRKIETSPRMVSPYGGFISYQANVDPNGNNIIGDPANDCVISVHPSNAT